MLAHGSRHCVVEAVLSNSCKFLHCIMLHCKAEIEEEPVDFGALSFGLGQLHAGETEDAIKFPKSSGELTTPRAAPRVVIPRTPVQVSQPITKIIKCKVFSKHF